MKQKEEGLYNSYFVMMMKDLWRQIRFSGNNFPYMSF